MARIIVTADPSEQDGSPVVLEERVYPVHLASDQSAAQVIERLAWAVSDAERRGQVAERRGQATERVA
jgi:hypothetical protein